MSINNSFLNPTRRHLSQQVNQCFMLLHPKSLVLRLSRLRQVTPLEREGIGILNAIFRLFIYNFSVAI